MKFTKITTKKKAAAKETTIKDYVMVRATVTFPVHVDSLNDEYGVGSYLQCAADDWLDTGESDITVVETSPVTVKDLQDFAKTVKEWYISTGVDSDSDDLTIQELIEILSKQTKKK
jgi:hypothetical protein